MTAEFSRSSDERDLCPLCVIESCCVSVADGTLDSGKGSTVYSDSHSSQQSVLYQSLLEPVAMATQQVCIWRRLVRSHVGEMHRGSRGHAKLLSGCYDMLQGLLLNIEYFGVRIAYEKFLWGGSGGEIFA